MIPRQNLLHDILFATNLGRSISREAAYKGLLSALLDADRERRIQQMDLLLYSLMAKGPDRDEVIGLLEAVFAFDDFNPATRPLFSSNRKTITVAGSGKKGWKTVNISSLASIVAACDGRLTVLKLCSPSTSSVTGSQDFLHVIGGHLPEDRILSEQITENLAIGFFSVENVFPRFASVYSGRYYAPHAMSFALAGMACRYKTDYLYYGLAHPNVSLSLDIFRHYGYPQALVASSTFNGLHYIDEVLSQCGVSLQGYADSSELTPKLSTFFIDDEIKLTYAQPVHRAVAQVSDPLDNVAKGLSALTGNQTLAAQVALNAATYLVASGLEQGLSPAYEKCLGIVQSGVPVDKLRQLVVATGGTTSTIERLLVRAKSFVDISLE